MIKDKLLALAEDHQASTEAPTFDDPAFDWVAYGDKEIAMGEFEQVPLGEPVLTIDGHVVCRLGDLSMIIGKAKARKSFFVSLIVGQSFDAMPVGKDQILYIDTEQHRGHVALVRDRIKKIANSPLTGKLRLMPMRRFKPKHISALIKQYLERCPDLGLVIIDGVRDLLGDINDSEASMELSRQMMEWSEIYNVHIMCCLHTNKADNNARGHIGAEFTNKGTTILSVELDEADPDFQSVVKVVAMREKSIQPFVFRINEEGTPFIVGNVEDQKKKVKVPSDLEMETHFHLVQQVFDNKSELSTKEFKDTLVYIAELSDISIAVTKLPSWMKHYQKNNLIKYNSPREVGITSKTKEWKPKAQL